MDEDNLSKMPDKGIKKRIHARRHVGIRHRPRDLHDDCGTSDTAIRVSARGRRMLTIKRKHVRRVAVGGIAERTRARVRR
jgi:hypothetical protein